MDTLAVSLKTPVPPFDHRFLPLKSTDAMHIRQCCLNTFAGPALVDQRAIRIEKRVGAAEGSNEGQVGDQPIVLGEVNEAAGRWFLDEGRRAVWEEIESDGVRWAWPDADHRTVPKGLRRPMDMAAENHLNLIMAFHKGPQGLTVAAVLPVHVLHSGQEGRVVHKNQGRFLPVLVECLG